MSNDNGMVRRTEGARGNTLELNSLDDVARLAKIACDSGLVSVRKPEEAAVILLTGRELGLAPMQSLRGIYVVNGKPVLSADLLVAVVRRSGLCESWHVDESTAERCTITTKRVGEPKPTTKTWTMADAKRAGVTNKPIWQQYPAQMLRHRCAADLARECYSDVALGLYDPEEVEGVPRDEVRGTAYSTAPEIQGLDNVGRPIAPKSEPPRPSAFDVFAEALRKSMSLTDVVILWHQYAQALHNAGREGSADGLVSAWLEDHGHVLTATEQQAMLARGYTPDALYAIDGIAELKTAADVVQWRIRNDALLAQIGEPSASAVKMVAARRWARLAGVTTEKPGKAFGEAVKRAMTPPPDHDPPTGTDGPARPGAANDTSAASAPVAHGATPASAPQALDVVDAPDARSDGGDDLSTRAARRKHLGTKHHERAVVASYAAHSGLPHYLDDCTVRLTEIEAPDGTRLSALTARKRLVDARNRSLTKPAEGAVRRAA